MSQNNKHRKKKHKIKGGEREGVDYEWLRLSWAENWMDDDGLDRDENTNVLRIIKWGWQKKKFDWTRCALRDELACGSMPVSVPSLIMDHSNS